MVKIDLKKELKHLYAASTREPSIIEVPPMKFLMVDGAIEPGREPADSPEFAAAMQALYGTSYALKFISKKRKAKPVDYAVMPLEGLWWVDDGEFDIRRKDNWKWTLMILQPEHVDDAMFRDALAEVHAKKETLTVEGLRLETFDEGLSVQVMHVGPYAEEPATVERMKDYCERAGYRFRHRHHEIYLGDPRRADPAKLKTILRHPVVKV